jgi:hypothetical protein
MASRSRRPADVSNASARRWESRTRCSLTSSSSARRATAPISFWIGARGVRPALPAVAVRPGASSASASGPRRRRTEQSPTSRWPARSGWRSGPRETSCRRGAPRPGAGGVSMPGEGVIPHPYCTMPIRLKTYSVSVTGVTARTGGVLWCGRFLPSTRSPSNSGARSTRTGCGITATCARSARAFRGRTASAAWAGSRSAPNARTCSSSRMVSRPRLVQLATVGGVRLSTPTGGTQPAPAVAIRSMLGAQSRLRTLRTCVESSGPRTMTTAGVAHPTRINGGTRCDGEAGP